MTTPTVALVTMDPVPANAEHAPLASALDRRGVVPIDVPWDHPRFDWSKPAVAVIRSTWDYHLRPQQFLAWTKTVPRLLNPPRALAWNAHKGYLRQLEARAVPTIETAWIPQGEAPRVTDVMRQHGWDEAVVKPCISGGAHLTRRCSLEDSADAQVALEDICAEGEAMVQPYLSTVETSQERSLVFIDGVFSHAVRRDPVLKTGHHGASIASVAEDERWMAEHTLRALELGPLLYARVDLIRDDRGELRLMELELIEPFLYLTLHVGAADALADAIVRRLEAWKQR